MRVVDSRHFFPRHWHETYVIEVVDEGRNEFWCNGRICSADSNDVIVIHPGETHTGYPLGLAPLSYRSFYPAKELMIDLCIQVMGVENAPRFPTNVIRDKALARMFRQAHRMLEKSETRMKGHGMMILALGEFITRFLHSIGQM